MYTPPKILPERQLMANRLIWASIGVMIVINLAFMYCAGLKFNAPYAAAAYCIIAACAILALFYSKVRRDDSLFLFANAIPQLICGSFAISVGTYLADYLNRPLTDVSLIAIDKWFGFDWHQYLLWVSAKPWLGDIYSFAYESCGPQLLGLTFLLYYRNSAHGQRMMMALYFAGILTVILSGAFPALGTYVFYNFDMSGIQNFHPAAARVHEATLMGLRNHTTDVLEYPGIGIVTFPSYHTVMAVVLIYAVWPFKWLRLMLVPLNIVMIFSTPIDGGHYLTDVLGGIAIALVCLWLSQRILPTTSSPESPLRF
jgi:membrane-associated phospholipid phosphatase